MVTAYANLATFGASVGVTGGLAVASALSGGVVLVVLGAITVGLEIADEGADAERILSAMRSFKKGIDYTSGKWSFVGALASDLNRHVTSDGDNHETAILGTVAAFRAVEVAKRAGDIGKFDSRYRAIVGGAYSLKLINDAVRLPFKLCEVESSNSPLH